ncbi:MAG: hypothetical protein K2K97_08340 [Muribaculaceae bacterium]|nr:hypothetical protein [Muribaculaceae bacterium]
MALHIEYLLRQNDCVILPGIGAFINAHTPAHFDKQTRTWYPMLNEVRFNQAVNQDDGLLANSYARKYTLPFHDARNLLDADIKHLLTLLKEDGEVTIGRLGALSITDGFVLLFTPMQSSSYTNKEVGLIPVRALMSSNKEFNSSDPSIIIKESQEKNDITDFSTGVTDESTAQHRFNTEKNYYIPVNKIFAKVSASLIVIFMLTFFGLFHTDERPGEDRASVLPVKEIVDTTATLTGLRKSPDTTETDQASSSTELCNDTLIDSPMPIKKYHLIVGTFKSEQEAKRYIRNIEGTYKNISLLPSSTLYRVSIASSDVKSELITTLNSSEISHNFEGAWIWEDKTIK